MSGPLATVFVPKTVAGLAKAAVLNRTTVVTTDCRQTSDVVTIDLTGLGGFSVFGMSHQSTTHEVSRLPFKLERAELTAERMIRVSLNIDSGQGLLIREPNTQLHPDAETGQEAFDFALGSTAVNGVVQRTIIEQVGLILSPYEDDRTTYDKFQFVAQARGATPRLARGFSSEFEVQLAGGAKKDNDTGARKLQEIYKALSDVHRRMRQLDLSRIPR
ncbi:MAG: hypothetical protein ABH823_00380 [bacterium]